MKNRPPPVNGGKFVFRFLFEKNRADCATPKYLRNI